MTQPVRPSYPHGSGVYASPADTSSLRVGFLRAGGVWRTADVSFMQDKQGMLRALAAALDFPPHFGDNWDALADVLQDLSWLPCTRLVLELRGAGIFANAAPEAWRTALDIFERAASYWREHGKIFIVLAHGAAGLPDAEA